MRNEEIVVAAILDSGEVGGVATYGITLARGFADRPSLGIRTRLIIPGRASQGLAAVLETAGVKYEELQRPSVRRLLEKWCSTVPGSIIHTNGYWSSTAAVLGGEGRARGGRAVVSTIHGVPARHRELRAVAYRRLDTFAKRRADAVVAVDDTSLRYALRLGIRHSYCVENRAFRPVNRRLQQQHSDAIRWGYIGRFGWEKGVHRIPDVARACHQQGIASEVILQGKGDLLNEIAAKTREWLPVTVIADGTPRWDKLDVLLQPSLTEGSPFGPLEALRAGVGVVCTGVGGLLNLRRRGAVVVDPWNPEDAARQLVRAAVINDIDDAFWERELDRMLIRYSYIYRSVAAP